MTLDNKLISIKHFTTLANMIEKKIESAVPLGAVVCHQISRVIALMAFILP